jgi:hypothetical protein
MGETIKARKASKEHPPLPDIVGRIVARCDPARVMEFYYWSQEPGLLEIIRAIAAMPPATREALESFIAIGADPNSVVATWASSGRLTLESRGVGEALTVVRYLMEDPTGLIPKSEPH